MRVTIEVTAGPDSGRSIAIGPGHEVTVGRKAPATFIITSDPTLSRVHFALSCEDKGSRVRDLGSTAGTFVNGTDRNPPHLKDGDQIEAGSTLFRVRIEADAPPPALPSPSTVERPGTTEPFEPRTEEVAVLPFPENPLHDRVLQELRSTREPLFAILDAARDPLILALLLECKHQHQSLYEGLESQKLAAFAPYLVALPSGSKFLESLVRQGWGKSWGVYLACAQPFETVRQHLRQFLMVELEGKGEVYFRFYDPRVLRVFLPTCSPEELVRFIGPIASYQIEAAEPASMIRCKLERGRLNQNVVNLSEEPVVAS